MLPNETNAFTMSKLMKTQDAKRLRSLVMYIFYAFNIRKNRLQENDQCTVAEDT